MIASLFIVLGRVLLPAMFLGGLAILGASMWWPDHYKDYATAGALLFCTSVLVLALPNSSK